MTPDQIVDIANEMFDDIALRANPKDAATIALYLNVLIWVNTENHNDTVEGMLDTYKDAFIETMHQVIAQREKQKHHLHS